ncbi:DUF3592 domain-containing protein [Candidatus Poseidoniaceae archaeon]|nr:DUF3592 domain-containing protein [Candidatus Poseidoniaceae archaeon]
MEITLNGEIIRPPPLAFFAFGFIVFLLGCIWPVFMVDDFQNELEASSWPTTDATVVSLDVYIYEYQCGDSQNPDTCREYLVDYHLRYMINGTIFNVEESEEVSHFESRVWEVDYPVNSTREIAYNPENPEHFDVNPEHYTPFIPPLMVLIVSSLLSLLFIIGGVKSLFKTSSAHQTSSGLEKGMLPQSNENITFTYAKGAWGVRIYDHPTVEALAQKLLSFSCTYEQIDTFFTASQATEENGSTYEDRIDLDWLNEVNQIVEQHNSIQKYNWIQKAKIARIILLLISAIFAPIALIFVLPVWLTYYVLPWYGWIPVWGTLTPLGLVSASRKLISEFEQRIDQGLAATLMEFLYNEEY